MGLKVVFGVVLLAAAVQLGHNFGHRLPDLEKWIADQGMTGWAAFIVVAVIGSSLFIPDTLFAVMAGVLFGIPGGTLLVTIAALLTATLNFLLSRRLLRQIVRQALTRRPRLAAIEQAVNREGWRFQFLVRLTPINPVSVSYVLGATNTPYGTFIMACVGLIPGLFVEVYLGHVAKHVAQTAHDSREHSQLHLLLTAAGLLLCFGLLAHATRIARRAIARYQEPGQA